ncbi:MAG: protease HtpX, partial [Vicinamibacterales bacterium]
MPNGLKTAMLLGLLSGLLLVIGEFFGGANGLLIAFIFAALMNMGSYWFSDKIVLRMYKATEVGAGHRLYGLVERLARQAGLPMPKVYIIP